MTSNPQPTKCDEQICPRGRYGSFHTFPCGRTAKYEGKCGIHSKAAKDRRMKVGQEKYEAHRKTVIAIEIDRAVRLLEANNYKVTFVEGKRS